MANLTLRSLTRPGDTTKNAPLTHSELDTNFINIDAELQTITTQLNGSGASNIHGVSEKAAPADTDEFGIADSVNSWGLRKLTWANIKAALANLFFSKNGGDINGNINITGTFGIFNTGSVTQTSSKYDNVAINKPAGVINTAGTSLPANSTAAFVVGNSFVSAGDIVITSIGVVSNSGNYSVSVGEVSNGYFIVALRNTSASTLAQVVPINFAVIKGSA